ncbi:hypothetical protein BX661DRAFT_184474, partial [Kickxella alabastrina]
MKFLASALFLTALAAAQTLTNTENNPEGCYNDSIAPSCPIGRACMTVQTPVLVCPSKCGNNVPAGCTKRCKPCHTEVCAEVCICEHICPL